MLRKRDQLVKENELLLNGRSIDSLATSESNRYVSNLNIIRLLDEDIFKSQKETIERLNHSSGTNSNVNRSVAIFSFLLAIMLLASVYMLYLMNEKLNQQLTERVSFSERFKELFAGLLYNFQAAPNADKQVAVNRLIILGMVFMFISFIGYLLNTLGI